MNLTEFINKSHYILSEGAVIERIKRETGAVMDKPVLNAALIYDDNYRYAMAEIYRQYLEISLKSEVEK